MGMTGEVAFVLSKRYVKDTAAGLGAVKGAPATIQQIADIDGGHRITFGWVGTDGTQQTSTLDVMNGAKGDPGYTPVKGTDYFDGDPGYSPTITVTNIAGGHKVTVTSEDGPTSFNVMDGEPFTYDDFTPEQLEGLKGADGISPIVTITGTTGGHIVSFTDKDGVKDFVVKDGTTLNDDEVGLTTTFSSDKITKTFATLEEVNKRIPQHYVLPTPTEACNGQVVQFIGITTEDYVHNYFYECVQVEGSYRWVNIVVQDVPTKVSELTNDSNFVTETELNGKGYLTEHQDISDYATKTYVGEQIAAADHLKREIVTEVPTAETAVENVIYMLKVESTVGADKYKEYMLIDGEVACVGDTSVDLTDYAKKSEIPTELPANGGNADTVNTHTVACDVPEDAVFTDTVYDDTEVQKRISDNGYSEIAGGKNLLNKNKFVPNITISTDGSLVKDDSYNLIYVPIKANVDYVFSRTLDSSGSNGVVWGISNLLPSEGGTASYNPVYPATKNFNVKSNTDGYFLIRDRFDKHEEGTGTSWQLEEDSEATEYEPYFPSNKMLAEETNSNSEDVNILKKETTVNLLHPTLQTTTSNGITCTNNGDGTYTLSGTSTNTTYFLLSSQTFDLSKTYKIVGCPKDGVDKYSIYDDKNTITGTGDKGNGGEPYSPSVNPKLYISIQPNIELNNLIFKPMFTTNLDATYDDFVPYTGDTGELNSDVAQLQKTSAKASLYGETTINVGQTSDSAIGNFAIAFGEHVNASGPFSYAHGSFAKATKDYSHADGHLATASNIYSYARGDQAKATGSYSHAEGVKTTASGSYSHAEGYQTTASGECSYAEGYQTKASGQESHAEGMGTIAAGSYQHVEGQYNIEDTENKYVHIIGKGTPMKKRNIHTVDWTGNAWYAGDVTATDSSGNKTHLLETIHKVYSMDIGNSAVEPVVVSDFKIDPGYRYLYIINGSGTAAYEIGILLFINGMKFVPLSSSSGTTMKDSTSAIGIHIYIENGQLKVSRDEISYGATCVIYRLG